MLIGVRPLSDDNPENIQMFCDAVQENVHALFMHLPDAFVSDIIELLLHRVDGSVRREFDLNWSDQRCVLLIRLYNF